MSLKVVSEIWQNATELKGESLLVMLALGDWSNDEYKAWPSFDLLADKARVTRRAVIRIVQRLETEGYLQIEHGGGRGQRNVYKLSPSRQFNPTKTVTLETVTEKQCSKVTVSEPPKTVTLRAKDLPINSDPTCRAYKENQEFNTSEPSRRGSTRTPAGEEPANQPATVATTSTTQPPDQTLPRESKTQSEAKRKSPESPGAAKTMQGHGYAWGSLLPLDDPLHQAVCRALHVKTGATDDRKRIAEETALALQADGRTAAEVDTFITNWWRHSYWGSRVSSPRKPKPDELRNDFDEILHLSECTPPDSNGQLSTNGNGSGHGPGHNSGHGNTLRERAYAERQRVRARALANELGPNGSGPSGTGGNR